MIDSKPVILVVDDTPDNITLLSGLLKDLYKVKIATNGQRALMVAKADPPDLILLDVMMPVMDGYETCRYLKMDKELKDIPVIFLTAKGNVDDENKGFEVGAVDYIIKPISPPILLTRVKTQLVLKQAENFLKDKNYYLEMEILRRIKEISLMKEVSIMAMAALAEIRDDDTGNHIQRTKLFVKELTTLLSRNEKYSEVLKPQNIDLIVASAPLHDIGKVGISDSILLKPAALTKEEFEIMKTHTTLARNSIVRAEKLIDKPETFLSFAKEIAYFHHEKWDGSGYPDGLSGENIPLSARIMAVADVYDALRSKRVYKVAFNHEISVEIIIKDAGKHFDPNVVQAFIVLQQKFKEIFEQYK